MTRPMTKKRGSGVSGVSTVYQEDPPRDHPQGYEGPDSHFLSQQKATEQHPEDRGEEGEGREGAHRVKVDEFEPEIIAPEGYNQALVGKGSDDKGANPPHFRGLEQKTQAKEHGDGKGELVEEGLDGVHFVRHETLDVKGCGCPEKGRTNLQQVPEP